MWGIAQCVGDISLEATLLLHGLRSFAKSRRDAGGGTQSIFGVGVECFELLEVVCGDLRRVGYGCVSVSHKERGRSFGATGRAESILDGVVGGSK